MKKILFMAVTLLIFSGCRKQVEISHYTISGTVADSTLEGRMAYILPTDHPNLNDIPLDSAKIENGNFFMEGTAPFEPSVVTFIVMDKSGETIQQMLSSSMLLEKGDMTVEISKGRRFTISGTVHNDMLMVCRRLLIDYANSCSEINQMQVSASEKKKLMKEKQKSCNAGIINAFMTDPKSEITQTMFKEIYVIFDKDELNYLREQMEKTQNPNSKVTLSDMDIMAGEKYQLYDTICDKDNNKICLNDIIREHDFTIIEFWASYCSPCVYTNRAVAREYAKHKGKHFEAISISLDSKYQDWVHAIEQQDMVWTNVSNLKGWHCPIATKFHISHIPATFLFNSDGELIRGDLSLDELAIYLAED